jgi:hypothetical protein
VNAKKGHGFIHARKILTKEGGHQSSNPGDRQTRAQSKWDVRPRELHFGEIRKLQPHGETHSKLHYHDQPPPSQPYRNWPIHVKEQEAKRCQKEKEKEVTDPIKK